MKIVENDFIPAKRVLAINLFGIMFIKRGNKNRVDDTVVRHESIHTKQMKELLYIPFYFWYVLEWLIKSFKYGAVNSYYNISFEREAYSNHNDITYLKTRKLFDFLKYL